jgi:hypothetical protein
MPGNFRDVVVKTFKNYISEITVSRSIRNCLGLGLGLEPQSLGLEPLSLGLGLGP